MGSRTNGFSFTNGIWAFWKKVFWRDEEVVEIPRRENMADAENTARPRRATCNYEYMMPTLLDKAKENPSPRLLDVGCGSGSITIELAKLIPEGQVTGLDISGAILESAKVHAERQGASNISFIKGDVHELPFPDGSFDVVCTHQAVAHFHDHVKAILELTRVTRKGGVVCLREGDLRTGEFSPGYELLDECFQVIIKVHEGRGGTIDAGRRLRQWVQDANISMERCTATQSVWIYDTPEGRREYGGHWPARCTQGLFAESAVEMGVTR